MFALRIFIECPTELRLKRRLKRDTMERGLTGQEVRHRFWNQVEPMHQHFVEPLKESAHIAVRSPVNPAICAELEQRIRAIATSGTKNSYGR
jgi:uridine kinase